MLQPPFLCSIPARAVFVHITIACRYNAPLHRAQNAALVPLPILCQYDIELFKAMMAGEHYIRRLSNADIRSLLVHTPHLQELANNPKKQSAKVSRILCRFHTHKLIAKIPHKRRWRVTDRGKQIMSASLCIRDIAFPKLFRKNVA